jgi:transcriptional regulator with XRE-family HTH domain
MEMDNRKEMQLKCAFVLKKFLDENKLQLLENRKTGVEDISLIYNLSQLSSATGLRPATISNIFNGNSSPLITNVFQVLSKLNRTITQFGECYHGIGDSELREFESEILSKREIEIVRKSNSK